jgi:hypothetical protein
LEQDPFEGVKAVEMLVASFGPEVVEQKAPEDVDRLPSIGAAACVMAMEVQGVVFLFKHGSPRRMKGQVIWRRFGASHSLHTRMKAFQVC